jgi:RNA polymerase sigma factor (sigma-70 family)
MDREDAARQVSQVFDAWYPSVTRYAWRATGDFGTAEDIAQEAFLALYKELRRGTEIYNARAWVLCVVRRQVGKSVRGRIWDSLDEAQSVPAPEPGVEVDSVTDYLSVLSPREEEVLLLRLSALKYREIADRLSISPNSVNTLLARAIRKLQKAVDRPSVAQRLSGLMNHGVRKTLQ